MKSILMHAKRLSDDRLNSFNGAQNKRLLYKVFLDSENEEWKWKWTHWAVSMLVQCTSTHNVILAIQIDGRFYLQWISIGVYVCVACAPTIYCIKTSFSTWQYAFIKLLHEEIAWCTVVDLMFNVIFFSLNRINILHPSWACNKHTLFDR